jgi:hypothetical protein
MDKKNPVYTITEQFNMNVSWNNIDPNSRSWNETYVAVKKKEHNIQKNKFRVQTYSKQFSYSMINR